VKFFRKLLAETVETGDLIALRDDDVDGQAHTQNSLGLPELSVETECFLLQLEFLSFQVDAVEIGAGNGQHEAVERSLRPVTLQQAQDRVPPAVIRSFIWAEHEVARHIENDAVVEEIPVQLPGSIAFNCIVNRDVETVAVE